MSTEVYSSKKGSSMVRRQPTAPLKVLDLFAGIGGLSLGFESVLDENGNQLFEMVAFADVDPKACETLRSYLRRHGRNPDIVVEGDLTDDKTKQQILSICGTISGTIDAIVGGPPCQSFSMIGPRSGYGTRTDKWEGDPRDRLYRDYIDVVQALDPTFILFENVTGLLSKKNPDGRPFIDIIIDDLSSLDYRLTFASPKISTPYLVLNAADYGVPQVRNRVFIVGNRLKVDNVFPEPTHGSPESQDLGVQGLLPWVTVRDAIGDLPAIKAPFTFHGVNDNEKTRVREANRSRDVGVDRRPYHWQQFDKHYESCGSQGQLFLDWVKPHKDGAELVGHVARGQQVSDQELFRRMPPGSSSADLVRNPEQYADMLDLIKYDLSTFKDKYRKQSWDRPSTTIFAHLQRDGNRFIHPDSEQARTFTVREAARLQSFPDDYEIKATGLRRHTYIGNAVPPLLAKALGESLIATWEMAMKAPKARTPRSEDEKAQTAAAGE